MANNTIGWGQGATNNNIGWGRGSSNDIGWGSVYENSYVGDTDIIGGDTRFIITVKTDNAGTSLSNQFTLPWIGTYDVEWGDGSSDVGVTGTQTHTYASAGTYDIAVTADPASLNKQIRFANGGDKAKLLDIKNWGSVAWTSMDSAFYGCENININAVDIPNVSNVINFNSIFRICYALNTLDVSEWDTSSVTDMYSAFLLCVNLKTDFAGFDINLVTNFSLFAFNTQINEVDGGGNQITTNYDNTLISWAAQTPQNNIVINFGTAKYSWRAIEARNTLVNTYNWTITDGGIADDDEFVITVRTTTSAETFTIPTTGAGYNYNVNWGDGTSTVGETGNATHEYATAGDYDIQITGTFPRIYFNNTGDKAKLIDIKNWGNGAWTSMENAFKGCGSLTAVSAEDIPNFSSLTSLVEMFRACPSITSLNVENWDVSNVTNLFYTFYGCPNLRYLNVTNWDTSSVTDITRTFAFCSAFDYSLANWDITSIITANDFMTFAAGLSTANYDATLIGWEANLQATYPAGSGYTASININFGGSQYTLGSAAETARTSLRNTFGWTITDGGGVSGVLNQYTGAAAAYSLRNLSTATTSVVRVRADVVGQPEQDFTYDEIMDGTLATFVGAGNNGYVVTWYDQSGNGNHATQGTDANQPQIVASGVVITENGMPAVQFDGINDYLSANRLLSDNEWGIFSASKINNVVGIKSVVAQHTGTITLDRTIFIQYDNANITTFFNNGISYVGTHSTTATAAQYSISSLATSDNYYLSVNGTLEQVITSQVLTPLNTNFTIGALGNALNSVNGNIQEIIVYPSYQGTNRTNIEGNINDYYSIY